jgi:hypothetical protein
VEAAAAPRLTGQDELMRPNIDTTKPHAARMYDYLLGGKDNFAVDRETAEKAVQSWHSVRTAARENRAFLGRAVRYLVREAGIRQFLDIGTGLPAANNVHEVAQQIAPECRVVYADNDPIVLAHARALLASSPAGRTAYIDADLREPEKILASGAVTQTLDLSRPVALMLVAILHFLPDEDNPERSVSTLLGALPPGSYLVASHATEEYDPEGVGGAGRAYQARGLTGQLRTMDELAELAFRGLEMVDPGLVPLSEWRPEGGRPRPQPAEVSSNGGVGRKP